MSRHELTDWYEFPAPSLERIMVCGWQERHRTTAGYWWYEEDVSDDRGLPMGAPRAQFWTHIALPKFPERGEAA